ncbi:MAG TPA: hypothetical protein VK922_18835 [Gemmatimonadaceae bacterium]|nr:hypothetical protein [Gemmatimonadaceae bacterium]
MNRHLLPAEIDLLLDGEVGFGTAPLKAHVRRCEACRSELEAARSLVRQLEHLPRFAPSHAFANAVMSRVQIYVPWYITAWDRVQALVPRSRPGRALAGAGALGVATAITLLSLAVITRLDALIFAIDLGYMRLQEWGSALLAAAVSAALGEAALEAVRSAGMFGLLVMLSLVILTTAGAAGLVRGLVRGRGR